MYLDLDDGDLALNGALGRRIVAAVSIQRQPGLPHRVKDLC